MSKLNKLISNYESYLNNNIKSAESEIAKTTDEKIIKNQNHIISYINKIKEFGIKDYYALGHISEIHYLVDNFNYINENVRDAMIKHYGIEKNDEMYVALQQGSNKEELKNIIWKDYLGMDFDLLPKYEFDRKLEEVRTNPELTDKEILEYIDELEMQSGYTRRGTLESPGFTKGGDFDPEYMKARMESIRKSNIKTL